MPSVIIRVELVGTPSGEVYDSLHGYMATKGLNRTIRGDNGLQLDLPHGMYSGVTNLLVDALAAELKDHIASSIWTKPLVMVIEWQNWATSRA
jgi:hypothetical protein